MSEASPEPRTSATGLAAATTAVVVWGVSSVAIKQVEGLNGIGVACYRIWLGATVVTTVYLARGGRLTRALMRASFLGGLTFTADLVLFFCAVQITSVANATIIGALQPVLVLAVAGPLFGERARATEVLWGAVAIVGTTIVVLGGDAGGANSLRGDLLAVGALFAWTAYFVCTKSARQSLSAFEFLTGMAIWSAVLVVPLPIIVTGSLGATDARGWITIVYIALVNGLIGHFLMAKAHGHVTLLTISLLTLAIPVFSAAAAAVVIDEPLTATQVGGMSIVLFALAMVSWATARRSPALVDADVEAVGTAPHP
ncbi:MAG: DMT family transporter [Acidimicrobiales bacterium]